MRTEVRKQERVVVNNYTVYIASDGKEFDNRIQCENHETSLIRETAEEACKHLKLKYDFHPIGYEGEYGDTYSWYKLESEDDFNLVKKFYELFEDHYISSPKQYPSILCVTEPNYDYSFADFDYLEDMMERTKIFFKEFGINTSFDKKGE